MDVKLKQSQASKVRVRLTRLLEPHGFAHTRATYWARPSGSIVQFVHLHLFSFCPAFRVHPGVRVLNDSFAAVALNGPSADSPRKFDLSFDDSAESVERCAHELARYCELVVLPWLERWSDPSQLLTAPDSPLPANARQLLAQALEGQADEDQVRRSRVLLGLEHTVPRS